MGNFEAQLITINSSNRPCELHHNSMLLLLHYELKKYKDKIAVIPRKEGLAKGLCTGFWAHEWA